MTWPLAEKRSCFGLRCMAIVTGPPAHSRSSTISRRVEHWVHVRRRVGTWTGGGRKNQHRWRNHRGLRDGVSRTDAGAGAAGGDLRARRELLNERGRSGGGRLAGSVKEERGSRSWFSKSSTVSVSSQPGGGSAASGQE